MDTLTTKICACDSGEWQLKIGTLCGLTYSKAKINNKKKQDLSFPNIKNTVFLKSVTTILSMQTTPFPLGSYRTSNIAYSAMQ